MQFRVKQQVSKPDKSEIPTKLSCLEHLIPTDNMIVRKNTLIESTDEFGRSKLLLNNMEWDQLPLTETP